MSIMSLPIALAHVRVDAGADDALVTLYLEAAEQSAADYLNRKVYANQADLDAAVSEESAGDDPMVINAAVKAAILLTLGHLYAHRETVATGVSVAELPFGARSLLRPHRRIAGV